MRWWPLSTRSRLCRLAGLSEERARLSGARVVRVRGVAFLIRPALPADFLGSELHAFAPFKEARDRIGDEQWQARAAKALAEGKPGELQEVTAGIRKHFGAVFAKAVLWPRVTDPHEPGTVALDDLLAGDMGAAGELFQHILAASGLKKKLAT